MKKGFTLIEIIISIALISLLILSISGLISISIKMNLEADKRDKCFNIAGSICEIYKAASDTYSNSGTEISIYKYINDLSDFQSINNVIQNKDGEYTESNFTEIINNSNGFKYTLILKIKKLQNIENMECLWIDVVRNDNLMKISMNIAK